jgi:hypothetical protein
VLRFGAICCIFSSIPTILFRSLETSVAITNQSLPPCVCTDSFSLISSSPAHVPVEHLHSLGRCCDPRYIAPSATTLMFRSTRNQRGNGNPILATVRLCYIFLLIVFVWYPRTHTLVQFVDAGNQGIVHAIFYYTDFPFDPEPARQLQPNSCHRAFVLHPSA